MSDAQKDARQRVERDIGETLQVHGTVDFAKYSAALGLIAESRAECDRLRAALAYHQKTVCSCDDGHTCNVCALLSTRETPNG
jgi:hypothetical protein